jgi:hypothetical protein
MKVRKITHVTVREATMTDTLRRSIGKVVAGMVLAIGSVALAAAPASANAVCSTWAPDLTTFMAYAWSNGDYLATGTGYLRNEPTVYADFQQALQTYCGNQNIAQMLENMDPSYSSWSQDDQALFTAMSSGIDPRQGFASVSTHLFQNGSSYLSYLEQHQNDLANADSPMQAQQATGEINSDIASGVASMTQIQAGQQLNEAIGRAQGYSNTGQMLDLNSDPSSGWDW